MKFYRNTLILALAAVATLGALNASARPGTEEQRKPTVISEKATKQPSSSGRAGGGENSGMKRASVLAEARDQSPKKQQPQVVATAPVQPKPAVAPSPIQRPSDRRDWNSGNGNAYPPRYGQAWPQPQPQVQQRGGYTGGQVAGAAVGGAVGGYVLSEATRREQPQIVVVNPGAASPGYAPQYPQYPQTQQYPQAQQPQATWNPPAEVTNPQPTLAQTAPQPAQPAPQPAPAQVSPAPSAKSSGMGVMGWLLTLSLLAGVAFLAYRFFLSRPVATPTLSPDVPPPSTRRNNAAPAAAPQAYTPPVSADDELLNIAGSAFRDVQRAYSERDLVSLQRLVDVSYLPAFTSGMQADTGGGVKVFSCKVVGDRVLGFERQDSRYVGSLHYMADISEGHASSEEIEELWHFVRNDGEDWKLAGIEQV